MTSDNEYRLQAWKAQREAQHTLGNDREAWLRIAQGWLSLIRTKPPASDAETFETYSTATRTNDESSTSQ